MASTSRRGGSRNGRAAAARAESAAAVAEAPAPALATVGQYLIVRLAALGVEHVFGIPGDYVLQLYKLIEESPIKLVGMTREDIPPAPGKPPRTAMRFGRQKINLRPIAASKEDWFTADHEAAGSEDLCFLTDATPAVVVQHLRAEGVAIVTGPGRRQGALGTLISVYCRDPDGNLIEIASYLES